MPGGSGSGSNPSAQDPFVCSRCARTGPTCCRLLPGQEEFCFPVSLEEKARIREVAADKGGFELQANSEAFLQHVARLFPGEEAEVRALFHPRKEHIRLAVDADGACRFLGASGCRLPREVRPYYCRLFPFWVAEGGVTAFDSPTCLARQESVSIRRLLAALGARASEVKDLYGRLRLLWGLPPAKGLKPVKKGF